MKPFRAGFLGILTGVVAAQWPARAAAAEPDVSVVVDCPELGEEPRAALESRANTELLVRRTKGTLRVSCRQGTVAIRWEPALGESREQRIPTSAQPVGTVEQVLATLESLLGPATAN